MTTRPSCTWRTGACCGGRRNSSIRRRRCRRRMAGRSRWPAKAGRSSSSLVALWPRDVAAARRTVCASTWSRPSSPCAAPPRKPHPRPRRTSTEPTAMTRTDVADIGAALVELPNDDLTATFNRTQLRWALERLASLDFSQVAVASGTTPVVDLPPPHGSVRFLGPNPSAAVVKPSTRHDIRVVLLALLVLRSDGGRKPPIIEATADRLGQRAAGGTVGGGSSSPRVVLDPGPHRVLLHLGDGEREQLDSLAASARGAKLYRPVGAGPNGRRISWWPSRSDHRRATPEPCSASWRRSPR